MTPDHSGSLILICPSPGSVRLPSSTAIRASNLPSGTMEERLETWQRRMLAAGSPLSLAAAGQGDAWNQLAAGYAACPTADKSWWVASPAAGLLEVNEPCPHAHASFSLESPDRMAEDADSLQRWWEALNRKRAGDGYPAGITGLARRHPEATFLVVLNADALAVLHPDLWEAREAVRDPDRFLVLSGGAPACLGLGTSILRVDARFEKLLGGPRATVAPRMARHLLSEFTHAELRAGFLQTWLKQMSWRLPMADIRRKSAARKKISSLELESFVRRELAESPKSRPATLLRKLHEAGKSCDPKALAVFHQRYALPLLPSEN